MDSGANAMPENEDRFTRLERMLEDQQLKLSKMQPTISAINEYLSEATATTAAQMKTITGMSEIFGTLFDRLHKRFDNIDVKLGEIEGKLDGVIGVVNNWKLEPPSQKPD